MSPQLVLNRVDVSTVIYIFLIRHYLLDKQNPPKKNSAVWRSVDQYASDNRPMTLRPHLAMGLPFRYKLTNTIFNIILAYYTKKDEL